jgi:hypothetical protein
MDADLAQLARDACSVAGDSHERPHAVRPLVAAIQAASDPETAFAEVKEAVTAELGNSHAAGMLVGQIRCRLEVVDRENERLGGVKDAAAAFATDLMSAATERARAAHAVAVTAMAVRTQAPRRAAPRARRAAGLRRRTTSRTVRAGPDSDEPEPPERRLETARRGRLLLAGIVGMREALDADDSEYARELAASMELDAAEFVTWLEREAA